MENGQDKKIKSTATPEEELFEELDTMYQRVADIEKEEEEALFSTYGTQPAPEKPLREKIGRNERRPYRPMILGAIAVLFAFILGITLWKPMAIFQLLRIGKTQQPTVTLPPAPRKPPSDVTPPASPTPLDTSPVSPKSPSVVTPPVPPTPPTVATPPASPMPFSESVPAQTKQEATKTTQEEVKKEEAKSISREIKKPDNSLPPGKYYAIQVGAYSDLKNVRDLVAVFKKEGLDAYWISAKSKGKGNFYRVLVGQFRDEDVAAQFLKDKKIFKNHPDSFIKEVSSSKITEGSMK